MTTMTIAHLIAFNLTLFVAIVSPGPAFLFLLRTTLANGRATGLLTALGLATMASGWTGLALFGLDGIFKLFPWAYLTLKIVGASYLIWIAIKTWQHARAPVSEAVPPPAHRAYLSGLLVNLANPKSVLFSAAVIVVIFPPGLTGAEKLIIYLNHFAVELVVQPALALLLSTSLIRGRYIALKPVFDRVAASVLGTLGLRLLIDR
ncbi:LysE family transporter [Alisedimentitalea sp. MJ-SS2]|uniref:LysE family translocator n=1 Tax=Aliisedimentitalea sp. MJ-SS2 TaxID=3049795 RepID=UPI00290CF73C|nr:LysE family transporter [Alisedimentitalea sp. MJ-SS2]MDU8929728.1 LysE family transporter [Alisedimentitalea sp. MJ-SS2]